LTNTFNGDAIGESTEDLRLFIGRDRCFEDGEIVGDTARGSGIDLERVKFPRRLKGVRDLGQDFTGETETDLANIGFLKRRAGLIKGARETRLRRNTSLTRSRYLKKRRGESLDIW
jgi:hypothetical protein